MPGKWIQRMQRMQPEMFLGKLAVWVVLLCVIGIQSTTSVHAQTAGWPTYLHDNARSGFNAADTKINRSTVANLKLKWTHTTSGSISTQAIVVNGIAYWGSWDGYEHATNVNTNALVWARNLGTTTSSNCSPTVVGVASSATVTTVSIGGKNTLVDFVGGGTANFFALDATNGNVIWSTQLGSSPDNFTWSSPAVYKGSVYIGLASFGDCPLVQGKLIQLDAATGAIKNTFKVVPDGCTGAGVWGSPTIDATNGTVYFSTGNAGSCSSSENYSVSLVEVTASNLSFVHHWQVPANQQLFDTDFGSTPTLFHATINGTDTPMVGLPNKNGVYYAFNRNNINAGPVWQDTLARGGACPQCGDGSISSSAWDGTNLYLAGGNTTIGGQSCAGGVRQVDPSTGHFIWEHCMLDGPVLGAVTAVAGVVVVGQGTYIMAVDAVTGNTLFRFQDTNSNSLFYASASISNGIMLMGNFDGNLYALAP